MVSDVTEARDSNCVLLDNSFDAFIPFGIESNVVYSRDCHSRQENRTGNINSTSLSFLIKKRKEKMEISIVFCFYQKKMLINTCNLNLDGLEFLC